MKRLLIASFTEFPAAFATYFVIAGVAGLLFLGWKPHVADLDIVVCADPEAAAQAYVSAVGGRAFRVSGTGSMKPQLREGDIAVVKQDYSNIRKWDVLAYTASYNRNPIIHRAVTKDGYGWLMSGDSAPKSESWARVTLDNYLGTLIRVYRKTP